MEEKDVIQLYTQLKNIGIRVWLDGGWGVDALLGKQTRPHKDLDITIEQKDVPELLNQLYKDGYEETNLETARPYNFVLADDKFHEIDVHVIILNEQGDGIYGPSENGQLYPAASLCGKGKIANTEVDCISPEYVVRFHSGYPLQDKDFKDVLAICGKFNLAIPAEYNK